MKQLAFLFLVLLTGCSRYGADSPQVMSIQLIDRNGFNETISSKSRLDKFQNVNFLNPQPYHNVVRMFQVNHEGKTPSILTSYHDDGLIFQYLEVVNGRANGLYQEWYPTGQKKLEAHVIEGSGNLSLVREDQLVFDRKSYAWDPRGNLEAEISYEKGVLEGPSIYFYPSGGVTKILPYINDCIDGDVLFYNEEGQNIGKTHFQKGVKEGLSYFHGNKCVPAYTEVYDNDLLMNATYFDLDGEVISHIKEGSGIQVNFEAGHLHSLCEYQEGRPEGEVKLFHSKGCLKSKFFVVDGQKHGEEWIYYSSKKGCELQTKMCITWYRDQVHGKVQTWYREGMLESEKEMYHNKKHGISFAYYKTGELMMMEEYEHDELVQGSYFKKNIKVPVSVVAKGSGLVTLFDPDGYLLNRIIYFKGQPVAE